MLGLSEKDKEKLNHNWQLIQKALESYQSAEGNCEVRPQVVAVSKRQPSEKIRHFYSLGVRHFAENYLQEARKKMEQLQDLDIQWHFIGQLQKKKVNEVVDLFSWIHSLDRLDIAKKIHDRGLATCKKAKVFLQVNIAQEESKGGLLPSEVSNFLQELAQLSSLQAVGLMVFPPLAKEPQQNGPWFAAGKNIFEKQKLQEREGFEHLSMGTSQDYKVALQHGATFVRIGEALLGPRSQ